MRAGPLAFASTLAAALGGLPTAAMPGPQSPVPVPAEVAPFVPAGQRAIRVARADLDRDGREDVLLVLDPVQVTDDGRTDADARELVVLVRGADGRLAAAARSRRAVLCARCDVHDPVDAIEARPGAIVVSHSGGTEYRWTNTERFAWSPRDRTWLLAEMRSETFRLSRPDRVRTVVRRAPRDLGKVSLADWDPEKPPLRR